MRTVRNACFVILCLCWLQAPVFADCQAPGAVGLGDTEQSAIAACVSHGQTHCSGLCQEGCGTDDWNPPAQCTAIGSGSSWSASGYCRCVPNP
jgi:hypothetical protein